MGLFGVANQDLEIVHLGGERRFVHVIAFSSTRLTFIWPMCGHYEIIVAKNRIPRAPSWRALDHVKMKIMHWELLKRANEKERTLKFGK